MAGIRGNQAYFAAAEQLVKGTPITTFNFRSPLTGGNLSPTREIDNLSETDANRDIGVSYVQQTASSGAPEFYVRDAFIHRILKWALGSLATAGTTNFTHTITPANNLPYLTLAKGQGNLLFEQYEDMKVNELTISADAGSPLTATFDVLGRKSVRQATEWATPPALAAGAVYNYNEAAVTLAGGATSLVSSFELTIGNNVTLQQTDDSIPYDVVEGVREVSLGFQLIFETLDEYNKFHYGSSVGTTQSANLATTSAVFTFTKGVNNEISFSLPSIAYQEFPVEPDAGGDPVVVDVRAAAQRGGSPVVTATVKNQDAGT